MTEPLFYRIKEVAEILRIGRNAAYEMAADGRLPVVRIGKQLRVPRDKFEQMFEIEDES